MQRRQHLIALLQQQGFGDLQFKPLRRQAGHLERVHHHREKIADAELQRRQVDGDAHIIRPLRRVHAGAPQHQPADRVDQAGFFRDRNEFHRRNHAAIRVRPAYQRLEAGDAPGLEIDQRLVMRLQDIVLDRRAQIDFDAAARLRTGVHFRFEETERAVAFALGARQRHVGVLEQLLGVVAVAGRNRNADAGAADNGMAVEQIGLADGVDQAPGQERHVLGPRHAGLHDGELVRAEARDRVLFAQR